MTACLPLIILALALCIWSARCTIQNDWRNKAWFDRCRRSAVFMLVATYMFATTNIIIPLCCEQDPGDHEYYLVVLPYHECSNGLQISSALLLVGYALGAPLAMAWAIFRSRVIQDKARHPRALYVFSLVFAFYRPGLQFWELVATVRRILFVVAFAISPFSAFLSLLVCVVLGVSAGLQATLQPYATSFESHLEM